MPGAFCMDGCCGGGVDYTVCGCTLNSGTSYTLTASGGASWTLTLDWHDSYISDVPGLGAVERGPGWFGCRVEAMDLAYVTIAPNGCLGQANRNIPAVYKLSSTGCELSKLMFGGTIECLGGFCGSTTNADFDCTAVAPGETWCTESAFGGGSNFAETLTATSCSPLSLTVTRLGITYTVTL